MRKNSPFTLPAALFMLTVGLPLGSAALAQPVPPPPPGLPDLRVRIVPARPPAPRHEVRIAAPGRNHVWQSGYWYHTGTDWSWNEGRWSERPRARARWVAPRYVRVRGGYRYIPGHWSHERLIYN